MIAHEFTALFRRELEIAADKFIVFENSAPAAASRSKSLHMNSLHCFDRKNMTPDTNSLDWQTLLWLHRRV